MIVSATITFDSYCWCSQEHGKLCFEHLETFSDAQNNLPCRELKNTLRSRGFTNNTIDSYGKIE